MTQVRTRFAPSPTGYLHIGGARTALFNWLYARHHGGVFVLRIEDTDLARNNDAATEAIFEGMSWLGLNWDEGPNKPDAKHGPYFQSQRVQTYTDYAKELIGRGHAYPCFCTTDELEQRRVEAAAKGLPPKYDGTCRSINRAEAKDRIAKGEAHVIRFRLPDDTHDIVIDDLVHGKITFRSSELDDFVIIRSDGMPTYNFACVVDDGLMEITHVIRGDDHISNTPKQIMLYKAFGTLPMPQFGHIPMILGPDGSKLSKRHGAASVIEYRDMGFLPHTMVNYLARLGWSHGDQEIFTIDEMIQFFDTDHVNKTAARFDLSKVQWLNAHYIKEYKASDLLPYAKQFFEKYAESQYYSDEYIIKVIDISKEKVKAMDELGLYSDYFFNEPAGYKPEAVAKIFKPGTDNVLAEAKAAILDSDFSSVDLENRLNPLVEKLGIKKGDLLQPVRLAITGTNVSPSMFHVLEIIGKERSIARLDRAIEFIRKG